MVSFSRYLRAAWLPLVLIFLFVIQNLLFDSWAHLFPDPNLLFLIVEVVTLGILFFGPAVLFGARGRYVYLLIVSAIISLILISQYVYFSYFGGFMQASALEYSGQVAAEWGTIVTLLTPRIVVFLLGIIFLLVAIVLSRKHSYREVVLNRKERAIASGIFIVVLLLWYVFLLPSDVSGWRKLTEPELALHDLDSFTFAPDQIVQSVGIVNYSISNIVGTFLRAVPVTPDDGQFVENVLSAKPTLTTGRYFGSARGENLIYIQVESLESAVIGQKIGGEDITPNLNALAKQGLYFNNYYTQIGPGNTADAEFVTLNSLYPLTNTVAFIDFANNTYNALPALLVKNGYHTYALHGDVADFWNRENIYPALGYEEQLSANDFVAHEAGFPTLDDDDFLSEAAQKMAGFQQPFMTTVITLSSHTPFLIPAQYQTLQFPADSTLSDQQKNYLQSIHYTDAALGAFIADLKAEGLYNNSVIAIFGDHGSSTGISSAIGTTTNTVPAALDNSNVPLILLSQKLNTTLRGAISTPGSHLDLYPTVADLLGIKPTGIMFGQDLLSTKTPVITHRDPYSAIITEILTPTVVYQAAQDGVFTEGTCLKLPGPTSLPIDDCQSLYDQQSDDIEASDFIVRGNLIPVLSANKSP